MRIVKILGIVMLLLMFAPAAKSQDLTGNRVLLDLEVGGLQGLGFDGFHISVGATGELPFEIDGKRFEAQPFFNVSGTRKSFAPDVPNFNLAAGGRLIYFPIHRIGLTTRQGFSSYFNRISNRMEYRPTAGMVVRDDWFGLPGRATVEYLFPTGSRARLHGVELRQEFQLWSNVRLGLHGGIMRVNTTTKTLNRGFILLNLRFQFPGFKNYDGGSY